MPVVRPSNTCIRYVPMLRMPVSGSFVNTSGSVMNRPPSSGQHFRIGSSSSVAFSRTTSWQAASLMVFGIRSFSRAIAGSIFNASTMPCGIAGVISSLISEARSSSDFTSSARHIRSVDPNTLVATGMSNPVGRSNSSAGPPPGALQARSVTAAISRAGLTGSPTRARSRRLSRSARKSLRSECTGIARKSRKHERALPREREITTFLRAWLEVPRG